MPTQRSLRFLFALIFGAALSVTAHAKTFVVLLHSQQAKAWQDLSVGLDSCDCKVVDLKIASAQTVDQTRAQLVAALRRISKKDSVVLVSPTSLADTVAGVASDDLGALKSLVFVEDTTEGQPAATVPTLSSIAFYYVHFADMDETKRSEKNGTKTDITLQRDGPMGRTSDLVAVLNTVI